MKKRILSCLLAALMLIGCGQKPETADTAGALEETEVQSSEEIGEKQEIVLVATDYLENMLADFIAQYNQQSQEYYITYEDLSDSAAGYDSMVARLNSRLVSENCPDLVIINYNLYQIYQEAEALEDLTPYLEGSEKIAREDYLEGLIEPFEEGGELYGIPDSLLVQTLLVRGWEDPNRRGWSVEEFLEYLEEHPETAFEWERSSFEVLKYCLQYGVDRYIDYDNGTCFFDGEDFAGLLSRIKSLSADDAEMASARREAAENGGTLVVETCIGSFTDIVRAQISYEGIMTHMGYPSADGTLQCRLLPGNAIGLCANGRNKEAAWDIAEQYLLYSFTAYDFPAQREEFEELLSEKTTRLWTVNEDGTEKEEPVEYYGGEPIYALTPEQAEIVLEAVKAATADNAVRESIKDFVLEEANEYFRDRKTLEEAQDTIQARAQLYLAERQ